MKKHKKSRLQPRSAPSWRRELLVPLFGTVPVALSLIALPLLSSAPALLPFLIICVCVMLTGYFFPGTTIPGQSLKRPPTSPAPQPEKTRFQAIIDKPHPHDSFDEVQRHISLPEITTAPTWLQWLIAYLGWPLFDTNNPAKISYWLHRIIGWLFLLALVPFAFFITAALRSDTQMAMFEPASAKWSLIGGLVLAFLILRYRLCLVRLHKVYVEDAKTTGRAPFPALKP